MLNVENCPYVVVLLLILMYICGFFVALGSYRTSHLNECMNDQPCEIGELRQLPYFTDPIRHLLTDEILLLLS